MKAGHFNLNEYLLNLNESQDSGSVNSEGIIIPDGETKKAYDWLKKEYNKGKTEVKVEMKMGGQKFEPAMNLQTDVKSTNDFKSGIFGQVKTSDTEDNKKKEDSKKTEETGETIKSKENKGSKKTLESSESKQKKKVTGSPMKISATTSKKKKEVE